MPSVALTQRERLASTPSRLLCSEGVDVPKGTTVEGENITPMLLAESDRYWESGGLAQGPELAVNCTQASLQHLFHRPRTLTESQALL